MMLCFWYREVVISLMVSQYVSDRIDRMCAASWWPILVFENDPWDYFFSSSNEIFFLYLLFLPPKNVVP